METRRAPCHPWVYVQRALPRQAKGVPDLAETIPGMSDRMLSERLKELEAEGLVIRSVIPETPVRIQYHLTEKGRSLWSVVEAVAGWAEEWLARPRQGGSDAEAHPPAPVKASQ